MLFFNIYLLAFVLFKVKKKMVLKESSFTYIQNQVGDCPIACMEVAC